MIGYYNYSVILTYVSLLSSVFGLTVLFRNDPHGIPVAVFCLMFSGICDMFDGAIASKCKRSEEAKMFGMQIDSLCDLICFGAFPALLVVRLAGNTRFSRVAAALLILASVIRLGYFNVQEALRDKSVRREVYLGLPVTLTSLFLPFAMLLNLVLRFRADIFLPVVLIVLAGAEVSRLPVKKPYGIRKILVVVFGLGVLICLLIFGKYLA